MDLTFSLKTNAEERLKMKWQNLAGTTKWEIGKRWALGAGSTLALGALLAGCGGSGTQSANKPGADNPAPDAGTTASVTAADKLTGAGATFPYPLYAKWFDAYNTQKQVQINYQSIGSGAGVKQLAAQTVDFGASDAPLNDEDMAKMPAPVVHIPTVAGAVVIAYNLPEVKQKLKLDGAAIADIYLGKIKKWNDPAIAALNAGVKLPATSITVAHRSDGSGTSYIFTNYLKSSSAEWSEKVGAGKSVDWPVGIGGKGNDGVAGVVKQSPGGIGYVELAYARQNKLPFASVKNAAGKFVDASADSVTAAAKGAVPELQKDVRSPIANSKDPAAYPIAGFTYILVYEKQKDAAKAAALKAFLTWAVKDGQAMAASLDYAPLPEEVVAMNEKTIENVQ
jgi:phosphate transport system substrate-binding protein